LQQKGWDNRHLQADIPQKEEWPSRVLTLMFQTSGRGEEKTNDL
jgi:hypothetical protein